jgi:hypothetical protein
MMNPSISKRSNAVVHHSCTPWRIEPERDSKNLDSPLRACVRCPLPKPSVSSKMAEKAVRRPMGGPSQSTLS